MVTMSGAAANVLLLKKKLDKRQREALVDAFKVTTKVAVKIQSCS